MSVYIGTLLTRGRKKRKMIDERKQTNTPPAPTGSTVSSFSIICQNCRTPRHWTPALDPSHHPTTLISDEKTKIMTNSANGIEADQGKRVATGSLNMLQMAWSCLRL